ncbi:4374_t:CDS:10 [Diversispora eburnea]|uniref:4374_t:CDS:1 n=1 Tax=Diversispora eburnea TaxID=1213867 RepID=A0A9N8V1C5_9GLOM|nr:4374_t:CDS:10 [Diversispora eburnea]
MFKKSKNSQKTNQRSFTVNLDRRQDESDDQESVDSQTDGLIDQSAYESLLIPYNYNSNIDNGKHINSGLKPGIYLKKLLPDDDEIPKFIVLFWSEDGCYKGSASSYLKKNMTNFHRLYNESLKSHEEERIKMRQDTKNKINEDTTIIKQMAYQLVKQTYSNFEEKTTDNIKILSDKTVDDDEIIRLEQKYPKVHAKLLALVKSITLDSWDYYKNRFTFAKKYADNSDGQLQDDVENENISAQKIFFDAESNFIALVKKYTSETTWFRLTFFFGNSDNSKDKKDNAKYIVDKIKEAAKKIPDSEFMLQISDYGDEKITTKFLEKYKDWKKYIFHENLKQIIRSFEQDTERTLNQMNESEFSAEKRQIREQHLNEICDKLEAKYPEGDLLMVMNVECREHGYWRNCSYHLLRSIEIPYPEQLCVTIYSTQLGQEDTLELNKNRQYVPRPIISNGFGDITSIPENVIDCEISKKSEDKKEITEIITSQETLVVDDLTITNTQPDGANEQENLINNVTKTETSEEVIIPESESSLAKRNCLTFCAKESGHQDVKGNKIHLCESEKHFCGAPCSLKVKPTKGKPYECRNTCILPCEFSHTRHECQSIVCPIECPVENCKRLCESKDHFHSLEKDMNHFCGNEHPCPELCEEKGVCMIVTEPKKEEVEYVHKDGSFMFTKYTQIHQRLQCCMMIPAYKFDHKEEGNHVHGKAHVCHSDCPNDNGNHIKEKDKKQNFHYCDQQCPNSTVHGNMYLTTFTCEDFEFEFDGHRLNVGDRGDFVLCHKLCENVGRHRHIDFCINPIFCESAGGRKEGVLEHMNASISPNPEKKKDYISHRVFWERTNFQDPYSKDDRDKFKKCDHECADERHYKVDEYSGKEPTKSYCTLDIFHPSLNPASRPPNGIGYISAGGHQFLCENPATSFGDFHIVFVVDRSSSMSYSDCRPPCIRRATCVLRSSHDNRLGAAYEAVYTFILTRRNSRRTAQNGQIIDNDTASLILFNNSAMIAFENRSLTNPDELLQIMMTYNFTGGTSFATGINAASTIIQNYHNPLKTNVVIFLSDGSCETPEEEVRYLCSRERNRGSYLFLYTVMFAGDGQHDSSLKNMANIANEYLPKTKDRQSLTCKYVHAIDGIKLTEHFTSVAESLRKHKPILMKDH